MSWDVLIFAAKQPPPPTAEMPDGWRGESMGSGDEIRASISACLPVVDWSDPTWGIYDGGGFSYEFNLGGEEPKESFMVHVRGGGDAVTPLLHLAARCGWYLLDCSAGEWLHHCSEPQAGWE